MIETETVELNIGDITITFLNGKGEPLGKGEIALKHNFMVSGGGIDPRRVKSVTIPKLDYSNADMVIIQLELYPSAMFDEPTTTTPICTKILKEDEDE